jgi:hypothetical protein
MAYAKYLCLAVMVAIAALSGGIVSAQDLRPGISLHPDSRRPLDSDEQARRKAIDDNYKATMEKLPDQKKSNDPWGNIRSTTTTSSKQRDR